MKPACSSRLRSVLGAVLAAGVVTLACSDYPLPPTDCDDWCVATQRGCDDDDPADCVRECETEREKREARACEAHFRALTACFRESPSSGFECEDGVTRPTGACRDDRRAFLTCMTPGAALCFELCDRKAEACGNDLRECENGCLGLEPACEDESDAFHRCALAAPPACDAGADGGEMGPCYDAALVFLDCVGF